MTLESSKTGFFTKSRSTLSKIGQLIKKKASAIKDQLDKPSTSYGILNLDIKEKESCKIYFDCTNAVKLKKIYEYLVKVSVENKEVDVEKYKIKLLIININTTNKNGEFFIKTIHKDGTIKTEPNIDSNISITSDICIKTNREYKQCKEYFKYIPIIVPYNDIPMYIAQTYPSSISIDRNRCKVVITCNNAIELATQIAENKINVKLEKPIDITVYSKYLKLRKNAKIIYINSDMINFTISYDIVSNHKITKEFDFFSLCITDDYYNKYSASCNIKSGYDEVIKRVKHEKAEKAEKAEQAEKAEKEKAEKKAEEELAYELAQEESLILNAQQEYITHEIKDASIVPDLYKKNIFDISEEYTGGRLIVDTQIVKKVYGSSIIPFYEDFTSTRSNLNYSVHEVIDEGRWGIVLRYINTITGKYIAVKYGAITDDIEAINYMKKNSNKCSELLVKYIIYNRPIAIIYKRENNNYTIFEDTKLNQCIIMENAAGTIEALIPKIKNNAHVLLEILYAIVIAIKCLFDIGLYYTDIKLENILYQYTPNGYKIILCDIGSAGTLLSESVISYGTVGYDIKNLENKSRRYAKEYIISGEIGILILLLLHITYDDYFNIMNPNNKDKEKEKEKENLLIKLVTDTNPQVSKNIIDIIKGILLCDKNNRLKLDEILDMCSPA